ncbi:MAG: DUF4350 domain-containing protein [Treponema sp.]|jgi:hypothetical protein|nr:DUF4350 domain-containing protein [Treponema sp.]
MDKRILICIAVILGLFILVFLFFHYFEIIQLKENVPPTREYYANNYLALERWLKEIGRPVNKDSWFSLPDFTGEEETIVILEFNCYLYEEDTEASLTEWIKKGNNLIVCLDTTDLNNSKYVFMDYIAKMGITVETTPNYYTYTDENTPNFHWRYKFEIEDGKDYYTVNDIHNNIRLIRIEMGKGSLTILGQPLFMQNHYIDEEKNAHLAWDLIGARSNETGILFVLYTREEKIPKKLLGALMQRGNIVPVLVSVILLIFFGFWMVIPVFGLVKEEKQSNARPIKERFAAEIGFLKKYKGLYYYDEEIRKIKGENNGKNSGKT